MDETDSGGFVLTKELTALRVRGLWVWSTSDKRFRGLEQASEQLGFTEQAKGDAVTGIRRMLDTATASIAEDRIREVSRMLFGISPGLRDVSPADLQVRANLRWDSRMPGTTFRRRPLKYWG